MFYGREKREAGEAEKKSSILQSLNSSSWKPPRGARNVTSLDGDTRGATGFFPSPLFRTLGRSRLEGHPVDKQGTVLQRRLVSVAPQIATYCVWQGQGLKVPTCPRAAKGMASGLSMWLPQGEE